MTTTTSAANPYVTTSKTVSNPVQQASSSSATPVTGTVGHRGVVEYSKSAAATVKETYVVTAKK